MVKATPRWITIIAMAHCLFFTQSCYLFCLFDQDKATEGIIEHIIEEKIINEGKKKQVTDQ